WPLWGMHYLSAGQEGVSPDLPEAAEMVDLLRQWGSTAKFEERQVIWHKMLSLYTQQVFSIGLLVPECIRHVDAEIGGGIEAVEGFLRQV
ncbi:hypothetical protein, partial [Rhizobium leguminosarum]|uniref:hypothetical protein n=1 Tax=Rhizobium leguminosarum TaxID=384 RepID=UPI003F97CEEB